MKAKLWKWMIGLLVGLVIGFGIGYAIIPKGGDMTGNILTGEEVRRLIREYTHYINIEVKPETIEFRSLELVCLSAPAR